MTYSIKKVSSLMQLVEVSLLALIISKVNFTQYKASVRSIIILGRRQT